MAIGKVGGHKDMQKHGHTGVYLQGENTQFYWKVGTAGNAGTSGFGAGGGTGLRTGEAGSGDSGNLQPYTVSNVIIKF